VAHNRETELSGAPVMQRKTGLIRRVELAFFHEPVRIS
jgi:hypothetical protein